jgi:Flp pilus assembly protein TadD
MSALRTKATFLAAAGVVLLATALLPSAHRQPSPVDQHGLTEDAIRDRDIAFYQARVERDPEGALDRSMLGSLYLWRARETGNLEDLVRAETIARESFQVRSRRNGIALHVLASALVGQHRYEEALDQVRILVADDSSNLSFLALKGEIEMELGSYAAAESTFSRLRSWGYKLPVATRLARWEELTGNPERARALLLRARDDALAQVNLPREQKAWFHLRVGDLAFRYGRTGEAEAAWQAGLAFSPNDHRLLSSMSRLELSRRQWRRSIRYGEAAVAQSLDPATLGVLSDAYAASGDSVRSAEFARTMELVVLAQPGAYHRAWSLYLLNHDHQVARVLANVEAEMARRTDVYGYDLLAWALYKNGKNCEAREAMRHALALGTREPMLLNHAAAIARSSCPNF